MFRRKREEELPRRRRSKFSPFGLFRMLLSMLMMGLLFLGVYSAYKSFSGTDPLKLDPQAILQKLTENKTAFNFINSVLSTIPGSFVSHQLALTTTKPASSVVTLPTHDLGNSEPSGQAPTLDFTFAIVADSHNDNVDLHQALLQAKQAGAKFVIGLGDYTDVGTVDELTKAKKEFDDCGLNYYLIPGDHDLWDSRNRGLDPLADFKSVFGESYQSLVYSNVGFVMVDNSNNYTGIDSSQMDWLQKQLDKMSTNHPKLIFAFTSTPLYHPSSDHYMGKVTPSLVTQADALISLLSHYHIAEVFAGDTHFYFRYTEPKTNLKMTAVGAVTSAENLEESRFTLVDVYQDASYNIRDTEIK